MEFDLGPDIAQRLTQSTGPRVDDVGGANLGEEEEKEDDETECKKPENLPDRPLPPLCLDSESADQGPRDRAHYGRHSPDADCICAFAWSVHIHDAGTAGG